MSKKSVGGKSPRDQFTPERRKRLLSRGFELLEERALLAVGSQIISSDELLTQWSRWVVGSAPESRVNTISTNSNPSVAMNQTGDRVVMTFSKQPKPAGQMVPISPADDPQVTVQEYSLQPNGTSTAMILTKTREFVITADLASDGFFDSPVVGMNGTGSQYTVAWTGTNAGAKVIRAATYNFGGATVAGPTIIASAVAGDMDMPNTPTTLGVLGHPSLATREDGRFVLAWDAVANDGMYEESLARVFTANLVPQSAVIELDVPGEAKRPVVAWNNGGNGNWDVIWTVSTSDRSPPAPSGSMSGAGTWLQKYSPTGTKLNERMVISALTEPGESSFFSYGPRALANDPSGLVGFATRDINNANRTRVRLLQPSGTGYANLTGFAYPLDSYPANSDGGNMKGFPAIAFDAATVNAQGVRTFAHFVLGTQNFVEGPKATYAWFTRATSVWAPANAGNVQVPPQITNPNVSLLQDMWVSPAINRQGNWWAIGWQYFRRYTETVPGPMPGYNITQQVEKSGWALRGWDPPVDSTETSPAESTFPILLSLSTVSEPNLAGDSEESDASSPLESEIAGVFSTSTSDDNSEESNWLPSWDDAWPQEEASADLVDVALEDVSFLADAAACSTGRSDGASRRRWTQGSAT